jgi:hypothetical protein
MKLLKYAKDCAKNFSLLDFGLLKLCVGSAGVAAGLLIPKKNKRSALATASIVFSFTLFPLMFKFIKTIVEQERQFR